MNGQEQIHEHAGGDIVSLLEESVSPSLSRRVRLCERMENFTASPGSDIESEDPSANSDLANYSAGLLSPIVSSP